ncbi:ABC transporter substrate-binding protein [Paenibacillus contaminans]|uniref:ABC transporter substrate-binding protein n=1 Tax=Paenibacillus contaminans TaxID=450362 RepID=UPI0013142CAB|nr:extracellular solute-binding protein [Paenibacillus contaminans]
MKKRNNVLPKLIALTMVPALAFTTACSSKTDGGSAGGSASPGAASNSPQAEKKVKLKLVSYSLTTESKWERIYKRWQEKHPNIEVEYKEFPNDEAEYYKALDIAIAGNEYMDVIVTDNPNAVQRGKQGVFLDVNTLAAKDNFDLVENFGSIMKDIQAEGKNYYLPYNINFNLLYYNKDMFDAKGVKYPDENTTYLELVEMAKKLTGGEGANKVYGLALNGGSNAYATLLPLENTGWNWVKQDGTPNFSDQRVKDAFTIYKELFDSGAAPSFVTMGLEKINNRLLFAQKKAAMIINNWWTPVQMSQFRFNDKAVWQNGIDFKIGATYAPRFDSQATPKMQNVTAGYGYGVSAKTKYPQESYEFAKFLATECADIFGLISSYKKADPNQTADIFNKFLDKDKVEHKDIYPQEVVDMIKKVNTETIPATSTGTMPSVDAGVKKALQDQVNRDSVEFYSGKTPIDDFLKKLQTNAEDTVKKLK